MQTSGRCCQQTGLPGGWLTSYRRGGRKLTMHKSDYLTDGKTVPLANRMAVAAIGAANAAPDVEVQALRAGLLAIATTLRPEITDEDRRRMQDNLSRAARTTHEHGVPAR